MPENNERLTILLDYVKAEGRVCPLPTFWQELYEMLPDRKQKTSGEWEPTQPLILAAWWDVSAMSKMLSSEHINYAAEHGTLEKVDEYLRNLKPDQWAYGDGTMKWGAYKEQSKWPTQDQQN